MGSIQKSPSCYSIAFYSSETRHFGGVHGRVTDEILRKARLKGVAERFLVFGKFDHLALVASDDAGTLRTFERELPHKKGVIDYWTCYGRIITGGYNELPLDPASLADSCPLLAVCFLKISRPIVAAIGSSYLVYLDQFLDASRAENLHIYVCSATGWEDATLILFGTSISQMMEVVGRVRGMNAGFFFEKAGKSASYISKAKRKIDHAFLTSSTVPAVRMNWTASCNKSPKVRQKLAQDLRSKVNHKELVGWSVNFEIRPGHYNYVERRLRRQIARAGLALSSQSEFANTFGQLDLSYLEPFCSAKSATLGELLQFLVLVAIPMNYERKSPIRSMETQLRLPLDTYIEGLKARSDRNKRTAFILKKWKESSVRFSRSCAPILRKLGVPRHSIETLRHTIRQIDSLSMDEFLNEGFLTLSGMTRTFVYEFPRYAKSFLPSSSRNNRCPPLKKVHDLLVQIDEWCKHMEMCLADRYRGRYPAGESMLMRLGTYQASHHRFLSIADHLAQEAFKLAQHKINERLKRDHPRNVVMPIAIGTYIGNAPMPNALHYTIESMFSAFIDVPTDLVFRLEDLLYVMHEVGHVLFREYCLHGCPKGTPLLGKLREEGLISRDEEPAWNQLHEIVAEYVACCFCVRGDARRYAKLGNNVLLHLFKNTSKQMYEQIRDEFKCRYLALEAICDTFREGGQKSFSSIGKEFGTQRALHGVPDPLVLSTKQALSFMTRLLRSSPQFRAFMEGVWECGETELFLAYDERAEVLRSFRAFLKNDQHSLFLNFTFLDELWAATQKAVQSACRSAL